MASSSKPNSTIKSQSRRIAYSVIGYFKREKAAGGPLCDVAKAMDRAAAATGLSLSSLGRIWSEGKTGVPGGEPVFHTPGKTRERPAHVTDIDDFDSCVLRRVYEEFCTEKRFLTVEKLRLVLKERLGWSG